MSNTAWRQPRRAVPIKPAAVGISINGCEKPVQLLRIGLDTIELEYHRCRCDGAALAAKRTVVRNTTERIVAPSIVGLAECRHRPLNAMKEVTSPARRKWSYPIPAESHRARSEAQKSENEHTPATQPRTKRTPRQP